MEISSHNLLMILQLTPVKTKLLQININYIIIIFTIYKLLNFYITDKENSQDDQHESDEEEEICNSDIKDFSFTIY